VEELRRSLIPLSWGAESNLYIGSYLGIKAVVKERIKKPYMNPKLAEKLIRSRTITEARILWEANAIGVRAPLPLKIDPDNGIIIMSFIEGNLLRDLIYERGFDSTIERIVEELGGMVAKLHNAHIVHGDLTTSNVIFQRESGKVVLIDFGLSFHSKRSEDKAMDLRVFERAVESTHPEHKENVLLSFFNAYFREVRETELIWSSLEEIRLRGRYIKERQSG